MASTASTVPQRPNSPPVSHQQQQQQSRPSTSSSPPSSLPMPSSSTTTAATATSTAATTTTTATSAHASPPTVLQHNLPSEETQRHVAEARAAVVASMGNLLDSELQTRANILHANAAALDKQEEDVLRATDGLRREREKLAREADAATIKVKELGNVQNWAEVLERGFLVLEETVRLANRQDGDGGDEFSSDSGSTGGGGSDGSCSCSECGDGGHDRNGGGGYAQGMMDVDVDLANSMHRQNTLDAAAAAAASGGSDGVDDVDDNGVNDNRSKDKAKKEDHQTREDVDMVMVDEHDGTRSAWSDTSRSLMEPESSTGTGRAKGSETASLSTESLKDVDGRPLGGT